ncbi:ABC transporter permease [Actinophytocola sp.]|uniref:ABC transporter permease n=1 Tax=Actinophytocola sp. TaxID=1872138 RepID=UPI003D6AA528
MSAVVLRLSGFAGALLAWEAVGRSDLFLEGYFPPPSEVFPQVVAMLGDQSFLLDLIATTLSVAIGLAIATAIAMPLGMMLAHSPLMRAASRSVLEFLRPMPPVALVPLAVLWIGGGPESKIGLAVFASLWPIFYNTMYAVDEVEPLLLATARSCGYGPGRMMLRVVLPSVTPFALTGIRLATPIALSVVISVEMLTGTSGGLGGAILVAATGVTRMDQVLAIVVVAGVLGFAAHAGLEQLQRRVFGWTVAEREAAR